MQNYEKQIAENGERQLQKYSRRFEAGHEKSQVYFIYNFILKTTSMHFDLTYYYYTKDFLLFSLITHSK